MAALRNQNTPHSSPSSSQIKKWRRYLAEERAEAQTYREIARKRDGINSDVLEELAAAEKRHENHWLKLLGNYAQPAPKASLYSRILQRLAVKVGSVFVLALMQRSEERGTYDLDCDATAQMAADEHLHSEVVRALAAHSRAQFSGKARAMVFGINDGLVSNLALIAGIVGSNASSGVVLLAGFTGLVSGALSMGAGEYISVTSQRELLRSSLPNPNIRQQLGRLDRAENELKLLFLARGEDLDTAVKHAGVILKQVENLDSVVSESSSDFTNETASTRDHNLVKNTNTENLTPAELEDFSVERAFDTSAGEEYEAVGSGLQAGLFSFISFSLGAFLPILPFLLGLGGWTGILVSAALVALALMLTGATMGVLAGNPPFMRAIRQVAVGLGAGVITYGLGEITARMLSL